MHWTRSHNKKREIWSLFAVSMLLNVLHSFFLDCCELIANVCVCWLTTKKTQTNSYLLCFFFWYFSTFVMHFSVKRNVERSSEHGKSVDICVFAGEKKRVVIIDRGEFFRSDTEIRISQHSYNDTKIIEGDFFALLLFLFSFFFQSKIYYKEFWNCESVIVRRHCHVAVVKSLWLACVSVPKHQHNTITGILFCQMFISAHCNGHVEYYAYRLEPRRLIYFHLHFQQQQQTVRQKGNEHLTCEILIKFFDATSTGVKWLTFICQFIALIPQPNQSYVRFRCL